MNTIKIRANSRMVFVSFLKAYLEHAHKTGYWLTKSTGRSINSQQITVQQVKDFIYHGYRLGTLAKIGTDVDLHHVEILAVGHMNDVGMVIDEDE